MAKEIEYGGKMYKIDEGFVGEKIPCPICETEVIVKGFCPKCDYAMSNAAARDPETRIKCAQGHVNELYRLREHNIKELQKIQGKLEVVLENGWKPTKISL